MNFGNILKTPFGQIFERFFQIIRTHIASVSLDGISISGPCLVLGSAPNPNIPSGYDPTWFTISVNASQVSIKSIKDKPDLTVMSDQMLGNEPANIEGKSSIRNHSTHRLLLIHRGYRVSEAEKILETLNYQFKHLNIISHWGRSRISFEVLKKFVAAGKGEQKISTGIFAALLAWHSGGDPIILSGFSFLKNGHAYSSSKHKRKHIASDIAALHYAKEMGIPLFSADNQFSKESGLPLWGGKK